MKQNLTYMQVAYDDPIPIYCDNISTINISKEHKSLDYGIQKEMIYHLFPIGQVALMTDEAPVEQDSTWVSV